MRLNQGRLEQKLDVVYKMLIETQTIEQIKKDIEVSVSLDEKEDRMIVSI